MELSIGSVIVECDFSTDSGGLSVNGTASVTVSAVTSGGSDGDGGSQGFWELMMLYALLSILRCSNRDNFFGAIRTHRGTK